MMRTMEKPEAPSCRLRFGKDSQRPVTWLEVVPHLDPKYGGVSAVVPELGRYLSKSHHIRIQLANFGEPDRTYQIPVEEQGIEVSHWPSSRAKWLSSPKLRERYREQMHKVDGVHVHGLWEAATGATAFTALRLQKPYIVSAHGMLESWALASSGTKKKIYAGILERKVLQKAACLHALTESEAEDYRRFGCRGPIAIIPNGIKMPSSIDASAFAAQFPHLQGKRIVLFLGRVHPKKGLSILIDAWAEVADRHPEAVLVVAGPESESYRMLLEQKVLLHSLDRSVCFTGMLGLEMKWSALAAAECFVLPSYSEGLSIAVLEAMGMALPVIVSDQCHMPSVKQASCGWEIRPEISALSATLDDMLNHSPIENAEVGQRGRKLIREVFDWDVVASQMAELYRWLSGGPHPGSFPLWEALP